jgi:hypothetical protein
MNGENDQGIMLRLRKLIGRDCEYLGTRCRLVEILADEEVLILEAREHVPPIQMDQYGQAAYRGNDLVQVPIFRRDGTSFSEEIIDLFASLAAHRGDGKSASD